MAIVADRSSMRSLKGFVEIDNLSVSFKRKGQTVQVLDCINFQLRPGEFACLLKPSGCGKSTILNAIAGFIKPTSGCIFVDKQQVKTPGADRGFVFQQYSLLPWKTTFLWSNERPSRGRFHEGRGENYRLPFSAVVVVNS